MEFRRVLFRSLRSYDRAEMRAPESGRRRGPAATGASVDQKARRCPWLCYDAAMTVPQPAMRKRLATMLMKRSEEHTSELQSLMRISYAVFCLKKKIYSNKEHQLHTRAE